MSGADFGLALSVFLACAVEAVEALTIVLAVGVTRSWPSALAGVGAAVLALGAVVAALGPAITSLPLNVLRLVIGGLLLVFGLQWLRKAVLRAAGLKALHDEAQAFAQEVSAARALGRRETGWDGYAFTVAFKGVLLEGLEVAFIVLTFGANQHHVGLAAAAAGLAVILVTLTGVAIRAPLARVPENVLKFAVGVMLTAFGSFWGAEGAGAHWPGGDAALLVLVPGVALMALAMVPWLRSMSPHPSCRGAGVRALRRVAAGIWDFVVGDDWLSAAGVVIALGVTALVAAVGVAAWWVTPVAVVAVLGLSLRRAAR